jgi:hypothetical protein
VSNHPRRATEEATRQWYSPSRWIHGRRKREDISVDLSGIDESVARDLVETIAVENRAKDRLEERKRKVDAQIREIELATSLDARHRLQQELANTSGQIDVLTATDAELIARVAKGADELRLRICSQSAAARSIRSSMQTVIGKPAGSAIVHARPQLSSGDNHE